MNLVLMERHGLDPSEVIAVGDRPIDIDAARSAGIEGLLLSSEPYPNTTTISSLRSCWIVCERERITVGVRLDLQLDLSKHPFGSLLALQMCDEGCGHVHTCSNP